MKLNLLPTYVSKEKQSKTAWVASFLVAILSVVAAVAMIVTSGQKRKEAEQSAIALQQQAADAVAIANYADTIMAESKTLLTDIDLANAMLTHNKVYPDLYDSVKPYIPSFFRVTQMTATPVDANASTLTLTGVLKSYQQYADLMVALLRDREVSSVSRSGFTNVDMYVPGLTEIDQTGRPRRPNQDPIPDDPLERLRQQEASGTVPGFTGEGGFGTNSTDPRGPMPGWSQVTVTVVVKRDLRTPVPKATLETIRAGGNTNTNTNTNQNLPGNNVPTPGQSPNPGSRNSRSEEDQ